MVHLDYGSTSWYNIDNSEKQSEKTFNNHFHQIVTTEFCMNSVPFIT